MIKKFYFDTYFKKIIMVFLIFFIFNCSYYQKTFEARYKNIDEISRNSNMKIDIVKSQNGFEFFTLQKFESEEKSLTIYIEGDGLSWVSRNKISNDPTPVKPVMAELASLEKKSNIVYIARPCQFVKNDLCDNKFWTSHRFSQEIILAFNQVIDEIKYKNNFKQIRLVGFSGGGAIATIISSNRNDVVDLRTIAGNLNHQKHSQIHNVSILSDSLNPIDFVNRLDKIPQIHFISKNDKNVTREIYDSFLEKFDNKKCVKKIIIEDVKHNSGWKEKWPSLMDIKPKC